MAARRSTKVHAAVLLFTVPQLQCGVDKILTLAKIENLGSLG